MSAEPPSPNIVPASLVWDVRNPNQKVSRPYELYPRTYSTSKVAISSYAIFATAFRGDSFPYAVGITAKYGKDEKVVQVRPRLKTKVNFFCKLYYFAF